MNTDQLNSIIRTILKIVSAILLAHGLGNTASLINTPDVIGALTLVVSLLWSHFSHASPPSSNGGSSAGGVGLWVALGVASLLFTGCQAPQLAPGGAYAPAIVSTNAAGNVTVSPVTAPETALFIADASYRLAYDSVDAVFKFEQQNRAELAAKFPKLKPALDGLRPQVWKIDQRWALARQAYKASPTPAGLSQVQTIISEITRLVPVAQAELAANLNQ